MGSPLHGWSPISYRNVGCNRAPSHATAPRSSLGKMESIPEYATQSQKLLSRANLEDANAMTTPLNLSTKLFLQFRIADLSQRRSPMRTRVRQVAAVQLFQQRPKLLALQWIVGFDGMPAHRGGNLVLAQPASVDLFAALTQLVHDVPKRLLQFAQREIRRHGVDEERLLAKLAHPDADFVQRLEVRVQERRVARIEFERHGQQQLLRGRGITLQLLEYPLEQHSLVRGVLVHQHESFRRLDQHIQLADHTENTPPAFLSLDFG